MSAETLVDEVTEPLRHVAIIMDGNNRWAKSQGLQGLAGHERGVERVRDVLTACSRHGIEYLTLFAFSTENWSRPVLEVRGLMSIFATYLKKELPTFLEQDIRLQVIGKRSRLSKRLVKLIADVEHKTRHGKLTLVLAVDYGGQWDIAQAAQKMAQQVKLGNLEPEDINDGLMAEYISLGAVPQPDLCIRTAGEQRISNFLLWQLAYAELYFSTLYWPDFDENAFDNAVEDFYSRQRRFGMTAEQRDAMFVKKNNNKGKETNRA